MAMLQVGGTFNVCSQNILTFQRKVVFLATQRSRRLIFFNFVHRIVSFTKTDVKSARNFNELLSNLVII